MAWRAWTTVLRGRKRTFDIYALVDPRDGLPRYIGCTFDLKTRINAHRRADRSNPNKRRNAWVRELRSIGRTFDVLVLSRVAGLRAASAAEQRAVTDGYARGWPLFNRRTTRSWKLRRFAETTTPNHVRAT